MQRKAKTQEKMQEQYSLNIDQIRDYIPHRAPFLFVDRILEIHPPSTLQERKFELIPLDQMIGTKVIGLKNFSYNEWFFPGHFPSFSIVPGVILIETMAQVASFTVYPFVQHRFDEIRKHFKCILLGVESVRFRKPVVPGDTVTVHVEAIKIRGKIWVFDAEARVDGKVVSEAEILANLSLGE